MDNEEREEEECHPVIGREISSVPPCPPSVPAMPANHLSMAAGNEGRITAHSTLERRRKKANRIITFQIGLTMTGRKETGRRGAVLSLSLSLSSSTRIGHVTKT